MGGAVCDGVAIQQIVVEARNGGETAVHDCTRHAMPFQLDASPHHVGVRNSLSELARLVEHGAKSSQQHIILRVEHLSARFMYAAGIHDDLREP